MLPSESSLQAAYERIKHQVHRTPVLQSTQLNALTGAKLHFKCENFQRMGAFKMRGALNAILSLSDEDRKKGVIAHSSGNFAQALALAAKIAETRAFIVMPESAPRVKKEAVAGYGGQIFPCENSVKAREQKTEDLIIELGVTAIHSSNQIEVILGNATAGMELLQEHPHLDVILVPVGGGGLIAGISLAAHYLGRDVQVFGAEPAGADDAYRSLREGKIIPSIDPQTICDGLRTELGDMNFPIIQELVTDILRVEDVVTFQALKLLLERMKIVVEPSGAITLGALLSYPELFAGKKVGLLLSGGNVDLSKLLCG